MSEIQDKTIYILADEIRSYLNSYPSAADSLEGITRWWLYRQRYLESVEKVQQALGILVSDGILSVSTNLDGKIIYRHAGQIKESKDY